jgi:hypothetical protein
MRLTHVGKDELVLTRLHYLQRGHEMRSHATALNHIISETAALLHLPVLDMSALVSDNDKHLLKGDYRHQNAATSLLVAKQISLRNWTYYTNTVSAGVHK